jgi:putative phosphoribosyl transferase
MRAFRDRREAGRLLAERLDAYAGKPDVVVLALPRGGVPVGYEVASRLGAPLDVLVVRKIGVPGHEELAMGAIASGGIRVVDQRTLAMLGISIVQFEAIENRERAELERRENTFRAGRAAVEVANKTVILVDDGLATGASMAAAIDAVRGRAPARVVVAVPIAAPEICEALGGRADEVICLRTPANLYAVGIWYEDFAQTTDAEVRALLEKSDEPAADPVEPAEQWDHRDV